MKRILVKPDFEQIPSVFHSYLRKACVYDSRCSTEADVLFIDLDAGYFLKSAPKGSLYDEATMTDYFYRKGLSAPVIAYESFDRDWLLTAALQGEDCLFEAYTDSPARLCDTTATLLRMLHETPGAHCPVPDRTADLLATALENDRLGKYDQSMFPDNWGYASAEEALRVIQRDGGYLKSDTLLHGDYCLPNIILNDWRFSGFIDLGNGGVGDRHLDLFWGIWSLWFNLKTDRYRERFLDVYGREMVNEDVFPVIAALEVFL